MNENQSFFRQYSCSFSILIRRLWIECHCRHFSVNNLNNAYRRWWCHFQFERVDDSGLRIVGMRSFGLYSLDSVSLWLNRIVIDLVVVVCFHFICSLAFAICNEHLQPTHDTRVCVRWCATTETAVEGEALVVVLVWATMLMWFGFEFTLLWMELGLHSIPSEDDFRFFFFVCR